MFHISLITDLNSLSLSLQTIYSIVLFALVRCGHHTDRACVILRGEAVLLCSAAEVVHRHSLDVGADLDVVRVRNQIRETYGKQHRTQ